MTANIDWHPDYPNKNVLLMSIAGMLSMDEVMDIVQKESDLIVASDKKVHTLIDIQEAAGVPDQFLSYLPRISKMPAAKHPNSGTKVVIGVTGFAATVLNIFSNVYRAVQFMDTIEEAYVLLKAEHKISRAKN